MNTAARRTALTWVLKMFDMGVGRFPDAEVQAELVKEKLHYQREMQALEQREVCETSAVPDDEYDQAVNFSKQPKRKEVEA